MSSKAEELESLLHDYSETIKDLQKETSDIKVEVALLKHHLQQQFSIEFDNGSKSHNRGLLYAQCGSNCQVIIQLLSAIDSDLSLIDDLSLCPKEEKEIQEVQVF